MIRVTKNLPCPICEHGHYCAFSEDGRYVACKRVKEGALTNLGKFGFLHQLKTPVDLTGVVSTDVNRVIPNWKSLQQSYRIQLSTYGQYPQLEGISKRETYDQYFIGWNNKGWTFPVWNDRLQITGMQVRFPDGSKCCVTGTEIGLFLPKSLRLNEKQTIVVTEGVSDAMAITELGYVAIGKFNCDGPNDTLTQLLIERVHPSRVIIVADSDHVGATGAKELQQMLKLYNSGLHTCIVTPPVKDLRAWVAEGLTKEQFQKIIK